MRGRNKNHSILYLEQNNQLESFSIQLTSYFRDQNIAFFLLEILKCCVESRGFAKAKNYSSQSCQKFRGYFDSLTELCSVNDFAKFVKLLCGFKTFLESQIQKNSEFNDPFVKSLPYLKEVTNIILNSKLNNPPNVYDFKNIPAKKSVGQFLAFIKRFNLAEFYNVLSSGNDRSHSFSSNSSYYSPEVRYQASGGTKVGDESVSSVSSPVIRYPSGQSSRMPRAESSDHSDRQNSSAVAAFDRQASGGTKVGDESVSSVSSPDIRYLLGQSKRAPRAEIFDHNTHQNSSAVAAFDRQDSKGAADRDESVSSVSSPVIRYPLGQSSRMPRAEDPYHNTRQNSSAANILEELTASVRSQNYVNSLFNNRSLSALDQISSFDQISNSYARDYFIERFVNVHFLQGEGDRIQENLHLYYHLYQSCLTDDQDLFELKKAIMTNDRLLAYLKNNEAQIQANIQYFPDQENAELFKSFLSNLLEVIAFDEISAQPAVERRSR